MRVRLAVALVVLALALGGAEAVLPGLIGGRLERGLAASVDSVESIRVTARTFPSLRMLAGRVGRLDVVAAGVVVGAVRIQRLDVTLRDVRLDMRGLLSGRPVGLRGVSGGSFSAELGEKDLARALASSAPAEVLGVDVSLGRGAVRIDIVVGLGDLRLGVSTTGAFRIDGSSVVYDIGSVSVQGREIPGWITRGALSFVRLSFDLSDFPIPLEFQEVRVMPGKLALLGGSAEQ